MTGKSTRSGLQTAVFFGLSTAVIGAVMAAVFFIVVQLVSMGRQIEEVTWQLPATIYAEPPTIASGRAASTDWLIQYFQRLNYEESATQKVQAGQYAVVRNGVLFRPRPVGNEQTSPVFISFRSGKIRSIVDQSTNLPIQSVTLEPTPLATLFGNEYEKRTLIKLERLPKHVIDAVTAIEDKRFFKHSGVDTVSIARALLNNLKGDGLYQGGSTITQQLVKNLYLTPEKTLRRKISEAAMAVLMEAKYSKNEILEYYLNEVYLGQQGSVSVKGIGEASQLYFKKDANLLTVPEAAMIAGLIQAPGRYDPNQHPDKARLRRNSVLLAMREVGSITPEECDRYMKQGIEIKEPDSRTNRAPYFMTYIKKQLKDHFSNRALHGEDYRIISTLDYDMQLAAQQSISEGLAAIDKARGKRSKEVQGSLIAIEPATGKIRAFVGGRNFSGSQFDRLTQAKRQPGSSFKPFVYAAALESTFESGTNFYTTSTLVADEPWSMQIDRAVWQPENYNGAYNGVVSLRTALAKSMNIATAKLAHDIGFNKVYNLARRMGFQNVKPYPSIALGAFEVSPYNLIQAYTAFANGGKISELQAVSRVVNTDGEMLRERDVHQTQVLHPETAYLITDMLKTVMRSGTGASIRNWGLSQVIAGKTGTTNDQKDAWFVGYTPDLICLVWVGYDDNTPVRMTGAQAALPIWARFMKRMEKQIPVRDFPRPQGVVEKWIDPYTGRLASYYCPNAVRELYVKGSEPVRECSPSDHYLPMEYLVGPEPRIKHASYGYDYSQYSFSQTPISYQNDTYTNYEDSEDSEMVDYSDVSFADDQKKKSLEDQEATQEQSPQQWDTEQPNQDETQKETSEEDFTENEMIQQEDYTSPDQNRSGTYFSSKRRKAGVPVYTNKDIPQAQSTATVEDDDE